MTTQTLGLTLDRPLPARLPLRRLYSTRGLVALVWAIVFSAVASGLSSGTVALIVAYPAIDVLASLYDARTAHSGRPVTLQLVNAGISLAALIGIAIATNSSPGATLHVFGTWATVSGLVMLFVAFQRRKQVGRQWAILASGTISTFAGININVMGSGNDPKLSSVAGYAAVGGVLFLISAFLVGRGASHDAPAS